MEQAPIGASMASDAADGSATTDKAGRRPPWRAIVALAVVAALLGLAWWLGLFRYLTLDAIRQEKGHLQALARNHPVEALAAFAGVYALGTFLMIPGTMWITVTGGLMFGFWTGAITTVLAGTVGGVSLFLTARSSVGGWLHARAGSWLDKVEDGFRKDALSYMFALRFMPVVPYPVANLAPALLGARFRDFLISTPIGLIPSVSTYTLVGVALGASLDAGEEPDLMRLVVRLAPAFLALGALALAPVAYKRLARKRDSSDINTKIANAPVDIATENRPDRS